MRVMLALGLNLAIWLIGTNFAHAADPWKPVLDLFRRPAPSIPPYHPKPDTDAAAAIERALLDAELQAAVKRAQEAAERAEEAAKVAAAPPVPVPLPKPKVKSRAPLSLAPPPRQPTTPEENDGSWLAPCFLVCGHVRGKTKAELDIDEVYWRVTARQKAHGQRCVVSTCPDSVPPAVLREMQQKIRG